MAKVDERVEMIGSSILAQAEGESRELIAKANRERELETTRFEEQIIRDMFTKVQKQTAVLRNNTIKAVSTAQGDAKRSLLKRREELADMVFLSVRTKLIDYVKTSNYRENILAEIESLKDDYDHGSGTVFLREADMRFAGEIRTILGSCAVESTPAIKMGGWRYLNEEARILIDETLDARLAEQKQWFLMNSGLQII